MNLKPIPSLHPRSDLDPVLGFFLLRIMGLQLQRVFSEADAHRYFSFERIAVRCSAARKESRSTTTALLGLAGITRP
jgi:hypothetical protein